MQIASTKYEKLRVVPEYAKDAIWEFHVSTEHGNIDGILRRVNLDGDMLRSDVAGASWQARQYENTPWADPATTREEAIANLLRYQKEQGRPQQQSEEAESNPFEKLWGAAESEDGFVATVDPSDMKNVFQMGRETQAMAQAAGSTGGHAIGHSAAQSVCSPGANPMAVWYRLKMLGLCDLDGLLEAYKSDGKYADAVFRVAATFPMKLMKIGVTYQGPPFDVEEFVKQIERASAE